MTDPLIQPDDAFLGWWDFDPAKSRYEFGPMPKVGSYHIETDGDQYLIGMAWETLEGQEMKQSYTGTPDGKAVRFEGNPVVDAMSMTRVNARTLDTAAFNKGEVVTYATRVLSEDGRVMEITMSGINAEGQPYSNLAIYEKRTE